MSEQRKRTSIFERLRSAPTPTVRLNAGATVAASAGGPAPPSMRDDATTSPTPAADPTAGASAGSRASASDAEQPEDLSAVTAAQVDAELEDLSSLAPATPQLVRRYLRAGETITARLAGRGVVRVPIHWMTAGEGRQPVRCAQTVTKKCVLCLAKLRVEVYGHLAVYVVEDRAVVALQVPGSTDPGALLPQLAREVSDPDHARLLLGIGRAARGNNYSVRRLRKLALGETIGQAEIDDFQARGGLQPTEVRDSYVGFSNADMLQQWPEIADLIRIHHPLLDMTSP